jgi:mannose-6-phosphate isomerase-like protein (cupin superfamily)
MSGYTKKNLRELEDDAAKNGMGEGFSARFAAGALECEATGFALQTLAPGVSVPFAHRHDEAEEVYVVIAGSGTMVVGDDSIAVAALDAVRVSPKLARTFDAGDDGLEFLVFGPRHQGDGEIIPR